MVSSLEVGEERMETIEGIYHQKVQEHFPELKDMGEPNTIKIGAQQYRLSFSEHHR